MKTFFMKLLDVVLNIIMVVSAIYAVATMVISFLPVESQTQIFEWLKMSKENIATFSVSSVISSAVLVGSKILQTYSKLNLTKLVNSSQAVINDNLKIDAQCVERVNKMIDNQANVQLILNTLLEVQKANIIRNINASEQLVKIEEKKMYKQALENIQNLQNQLQLIPNITSVYEKTEVKEIIVKKEVDEMAGRV